MSWLNNLRSALKNPLKLLAMNERQMMDRFWFVMLGLLVLDVRAIWQHVTAPGFDPAAPQVMNWVPFFVGGLVSWIASAAILGFVWPQRRSPQQLDLFQRSPRSLAKSFEVPTGFRVMGCFLALVWAALAGIVMLNGCAVVLDPPAVWSGVMISWFLFGILLACTLVEEDKRVRGGSSFKPQTDARRC
jgi:hypothetical protein